MDCPRPAESGEAAVACPPDDALVEILSRLRAKPLFRFKCVSKDWRGLITDRLRCRELPQTLGGFFAGDGVENYGGFIDLSGRPVPLVDPSFSFLTESPEIQKIKLLESCNGLVLFEHMPGPDRIDSLGYIVCNPATEEWVSVPTSGYNSAYHTSGNLETYLVFDPAISPHFELIQARWLLSGLQEVHIFSSATGAWRLELECAPLMTVVSTDVCTFNGMLHVGARQFHLPFENQHQLSDEDKHMILVFGGEGRPFRTMHWPHNDRGIPVFVGQSQGHLHCLSGFRTEDYQTTELSIWVLEDYNAEKWVLRDNVSLSQLFKRTRGCFGINWEVVGICPDSGLVFFAEYWNHTLISYDMDKKEACAICNPHGDCRFIVPYVPYFTPFRGAR